MQTNPVWFVHGSESENRGLRRRTLRGNTWLAPIGIECEFPHKSYLNFWGRLIHERKDAKRDTVLVILPEKCLGMVSRPLQLSLLLGRSETGANVSATRSRAFEVGMANFTLGHEPGGGATDIFGRAVTAAHVVRVDNFLAQSAWLLTTRTEGNDVETHCAQRTWHC